MRGKLLAGGGVLLMTAALAVPVTGLAGSAVAPVVGGLPGLGSLAPVASAAGTLQAFEDCEELRQWYVDQALREVTAYGLGGWGYYAYEGMTAGSAGGGVARATSGAVDLAAADSGVVSSKSGTNTQEESVDEPDVAKTDGSVVVRLDGRRLRVTDVTGGQARELASLTLPRDMLGGELLLAGDRVVVLGQPSVGWRGGEPFIDSTRSSMMMPGSSSTRVVVVDLADPAVPSVVSDQTLTGGLVSARQHADGVRLVLRTTSPDLELVQPHGTLSRREALAENKAILRESTIEDWLPTRDGEPIVACDDVHHPRRSPGLGTLTVVGLDPASPEALSTTALTTGSELAYSSADRLYLTTTDYRRDGRHASTSVHAFALDGLDADYAASGRLPGTLKDRWSLDEEDGVLRAVIARYDDWRPVDNELVTLREDDGRLEQIAKVDRLGPGEEVKSVRWLGDLAVVVTYLQTDPLFTVDVSDPAAPTLLGKLKIPGFSEYLHPLGGDRLLGVGQDADLQGRTRGGQVSLFDLSDLSDPRRVDALALGARTNPLVGWETRAFTWLPESSIAITAVENGWNGAGALVGLRVGADSLEEVAQWATPRGEAATSRALPLADGRVALVTDEVRVVELP